MNKKRLSVLIRCALSFLNVRYGFTATVESLNRFKSEPISRRGIAQHQSQFPHSCVYERFMYSHDRSAYSAAGNMWTDPGNI
jgi:hypothetical protein